MYCKKCGSEISDNDKFCQNCGTKVEGDNERTNVSEKITERVEVKSNNKKGKMIAIIIGAVLIVGVVIALIMPKTIKFEVNELSQILYTDECEKYYGDTLEVHGYLFRDTRSISNEQNGYYSLVDSKDALNDTSFEMILFKLDEAIGDDVGTGSEVTITGKIDEESGSGTINADSIEIHKREEMIYLTEIENISNYYDKFENKKVSVFGRIIKRLEYGDTIIVDYNVQNAMKVIDMTEDKLAECIKNGGYVTLTGTITKDTFNGIAGSNNDVIAIEVNECNISGLTGVDDFEYEETMSVDEVIKSNWRDGEFITIEGLYIKDGTYSAPHSIADEDTWNYIVLNFGFGLEIDKYFTSEEKCVVSGYLYKTGTGYRLDVTMIG